MTTSTFEINIAENVFALVGDGAAHAVVAIQNTDSFPIFVVVATTTPSAASTAGPIIGGQEERSITVNLGVADKVYARSTQGALTIRGFKESV